MDESPASQIGSHVPRMYGAAYRLLADADKAHDAAQEACVKALAKVFALPGRTVAQTDKGVAARVDLVEALAAKAALEDAGANALDAVLLQHAKTKQARQEGEDAKGGEEKR